MSKNIKEIVFNGIGKENLLNSRDEFLCSKLHACFWNVMDNLNEFELGLTSKDPDLMYRNLDIFLLEIIKEVLLSKGYEEMYVSKFDNSYQSIYDFIKSQHKILKFFGFRKKLIKITTEVRAETLDLIGDDFAEILYSQLLKHTEVKLDKA